MFLIGKLVTGKGGRGSTEQFGLIRGKEHTREDEAGIDSDKSKPTSRR